MDDIDLSLVIPAYNEAALLPRLLASVEHARSRYRGGAQRIEVIVADNASTDATAALARAHGCRVAPVEKRCIAAARNGGAALARGKALAFVDADCVVHPACFDAVAATLADPRVVGGASGVTMERWSAGIAVTFAMCLPMVWLTGMDAGVAFCRRADFVALGGYDESKLLAEDIDFLWRLRRLGRTRGQRLRRLRGCKTIVSTRKFDRYGDWHFFTHLPALAWQALRRRDFMTRFARRYWYEDR